MNEPGFQLRVKHQDNLLHVRTWGFWTIELVDKFQADTLEIQRRMAIEAGPASERVVLVDAREQDVQAQDVAARLQLSVNDLGASTRKVAVMISGALFKLQSERVHAGIKARFFLEESDARAWLLEK